MRVNVDYTADLRNKYEELKKNPQVTDDMEYYFISAQILKYYGYVTKTNVRISFALRCKADTSFKKVLRGNLRYFDFPDTDKGCVYERLYKEVLNYTPQKIEGKFKGDLMNLKETFFIGGCTLDLIA